MKSGSAYAKPYSAEFRQPIPATACSSMARWNRRPHLRPILGTVRTESIEQPMTKKITGGCACGRIRYECTEKPLVQLICHCPDCKRASGSAFAAVLVVPCDRLAFTGGDLKYYEVKAKSGR